MLNWPKKVWPPTLEYILLSSNRQDAFRSFIVWIHLKTHYNNGKSPRNNLSFQQIRATAAKEVWQPIRIKRVCDFQAWLLRFLSEKEEAKCCVFPSLCYGLRRSLSAPGMESHAWFQLWSQITTSACVFDLSGSFNRAPLQRSQHAGQKGLLVSEVSLLKLKVCLSRQSPGLCLIWSHPIVLPWPSKCSMLWCHTGRPNVCVALGHEYFRQLVPFKWFECSDILRYQ